jgi:hypothetical protein
VIKSSLAQERDGIIALQGRGPLNEASLSWSISLAAGLFVCEKKKEVIDGEV